LLKIFLQKLLDFFMIFFIFFGFSGFFLGVYEDFFEQGGASQMDAEPNGHAGRKCVVRASAYSRHRAHANALHIRISINQIPELTVDAHQGRSRVSLNEASDSLGAW
jgi:hypothetical protein